MTDASVPVPVLVDTKQARITALEHECATLRQRDRDFVYKIQRLARLLDQLQLLADSRRGVPQAMNLSERQLLDHYRACATGDKAAIGRMARRFAETRGRTRQRRSRHARRGA